MICQDCKMNVVPDDAYHPHLFCTLWKAYQVDPNDVLAHYGYRRDEAAVGHVRSMLDGRPRCVENCPHPDHRQQPAGGE